MQPYLFPKKKKLDKFASFSKLKVAPDPSDIQVACAIWWLVDSQYAHSKNRLVTIP